MHLCCSLHLRFLANAISCQRSSLYSLLFKGLSRESIPFQPCVIWVWLVSWEQAEYSRFPRGRLLLQETTKLYTPPLVFLFVLEKDETSEERCFVLSCSCRYSYALEVVQSILGCVILISMWALPFLWTFSAFCGAVSSSTTCSVLFPEDPRASHTHSNCLFPWAFLYILKSR